MHRPNTALRHRAVIILLVLATSACATGSKLSLESTPSDAEVSAALGQQGELRKLGNTPLRLDRSELPETTDGSIHLFINKDGYQPSSVVLPKTMLQYNTSFSTNLKPLNCAGADASLNELASGVAEVLSKIHLKNLAEAENTAQTLKSKYPKVAVIYDLLGNIHYLKKDFPEALNAYRRSRELAPNNPQTQRMIDKLSAIYQSRSSERR